MEDRELCLRLAEALGAVPCGTCEHWRFAVGGRAALHKLPGWLLTPDGAFAVLEAMRERGFGVMILTAPHWCVKFATFLDSDPFREGSASHPMSLGRAIGEAALAALEAA